MEQKITPLVSVIIPSAHRKPSIVFRAINSVLTQTYKTLEIILVDDNTDTNLSYEIKDAFKNISQVKYIKNIGIHGASAARNLGISYANGEIIAFLDDDDEWLPKKIEKQINALTDDVVLVYCNGWRIDNRCNPPLIIPYRSKENFYSSVSFNFLLQKNHIGTTTQLLVRKNALEQVDGFDINFPARQDYDLCLRLTQIGQAVGVDDFLFCHYLHNDKQITKSSSASLVGYTSILRKYQKELQNEPYALSCILFKIARMQRLQQHMFKAVYYYLKGVFINPILWRKGLRELISEKTV